MARCLAGRDDGAVRVGEPEAAHAGDEVLRHAGDEHVDHAATAAAVAARPLIGLDPVDEGSLQQLQDRDADGLGRIDPGLSIGEDGPPNDLRFAGPAVGAASSKTMVSSVRGSVGWFSMSAQDSTNHRRVTAGFSAPRRWPAAG